MLWVAYSHISRPTFLSYCRLTLEHLALPIGEMLLGPCFLIIGRLPSIGCELTVAIVSILALVKETVLRRIGGLLREIAIATLIRRLACILRIEVTLMELQL